MARALMLKLRKFPTAITNKQQKSTSTISTSFHENATQASPEG